MAELVVECPTPDGHMDFSNPPSSRSEPPTNLRIREFLKKHHEHRSPNGSAADSGNSSDDQQRQVANHSPPPNCSICLGRVKSKCFTDSCMHQFCFSCLLEWSKVKPECPLCKQTFKSIIHNVTSMDSYEEYKVEVQQRHVNWINLPFQAGDVDMNLLFSASLPTYHRRDHSLAQSSDMARRRLYQLFRHDSPLVQRFAQTYPDEIYPNRVSGTQWRQYIYNRRLYAEPLNDLSGQSRDISAEFYRANPAQLHRLMPWLHRELLCLGGDQPQTHPISYLVQRIETLIQTYDMTSFDFQSRVRPLIPNHTDHFIHELINYARSPYDLIGYDRFVTYLPRFESDTNDIVTLSSEEGSDVEFVGPIVDVETTETTENTVQNLAPNQSTSGNDNESRSSNGDGTSSRSNGNASHRNDIEQANASTSGVTTATQSADIRTPNLSGDDSDEEEIKTYLQQKPNVTTEEVIRGRTGPTPTVEQQASSSSNNDQNRENSASDYNSARNATSDANEEASTSATVDAPTEILEITPKVEPNTQTKSVQEVINADTGSDSDECLFVCAKKPPHLRTPEYVELNSDSDSDVVFVSSETCQAPRPNITTRAIDTLVEAEKSVINLLQSAVQRNEASTNVRRKRGRAVESASTAYTSQNSTFEAKPSTSETMLQWLIQSPDEHSRRISPRSASKRSTPPIRPRLTTTIKISRGKRIYESPTSDSEASTDPDTTSTSSSMNSCDSTDVESSSHEEYVCSSSKIRTKRPANNDGPSLAPRKKFRKRRGKRNYDTTTSEESDADGGMS